MSFCSTSKSSLFFSSVDEIPAQIWEDLDCEEDLYLHRNFLKALEKNHPTVTFYYLVLLDKNEKISALACIKIIDFYLNEVKTNFESLVKRVKNIASNLGLIPKTKPLKILVSGNVFVSGEHGIFIKPNQDKKIVIKQMSKAILDHVKQKQLKIDAFLLKDFLNESLYITEELRSYNYHPFSVEPNMTMSISENWNSFDDYLADMKTKFRVKAKKALKLSAALQIEDVTIQNINSKLPEMTALYQRVTANADFNFSDFNLATYKDLKKEFGENYVLKTYSLNDKIVGFLSGIINKNTLDAHFVGIDYDLNRNYAIYQRMLYNYVEVAIEKKLEILNFGRTASEIKSSVGAKPQGLTMYLRHKKGLTNHILKLFLTHVQPTPFHQHFPFKKQSNS